MVRANYSERLNLNRYSRLSIDLLDFSGHCSVVKAAQKKGLRYRIHFIHILSLLSYSTQVFSLDRSLTIVQNTHQQRRRQPLSMLTSIRKAPLMLHEQHEA